MNESNIIDQVSFKNWLDRLEQFLLNIHWPIKEVAKQMKREVWITYFSNGISPVQAFMTDQSISGL